MYKCLFIAPDAPIHILQPLWNVLDGNNNDISSCIMFTNLIKLKYRLSVDCMMDYYQKNIIKMDTDIINNYPGFDENIDLGVLKQTIDAQFTWLLQKGTSVIFPFVIKLLVKFVIMFIFLL